MLTKWFDKINSALLGIQGSGAVTKKAAILFFVLMFFPSTVFAGITYYVDCSQTDPSEDGSYAHPWNSISDINRHVFSQGADVYFKEGTTCFVDTHLAMDWHGTENDPVIIGCYDGENDFDCSDSGLTRPILDGNNIYPTDSNLGIIDYQLKDEGDEDYITIQDLRINNSNGLAIAFKSVDYITVKNCYIDHAARGAISLPRVSNCTVEDNYVHDTNFMFDWRGCAITLTGHFIPGSSQNCTIQRNTVWDVHEGIGLYQGAQNHTVQNNLIYDATAAIYPASMSSKNIIRYNLIYKSTSANHKMSGILLNCEIDFCDPVKSSRICTDGHEIYGNLIAGVDNGINIVSNCRQDPYNISVKNVNIFQNTIVNSVENNFRFYINGGDETGNVIKNNISWTISGGSAHANNFSPSGVTWSHNLFDENPCNSCHADDNAVFGGPGLSKTSGWQALIAGSVKGSEFALTEGSPAIDAATTVSGYDKWIYNADFINHPIIVNTSIESTPNIGAWMVTGTSSELLSPPSSLRVVSVTE